MKISRRVHIVGCVISLGLTSCSEEKGAANPSAFEGALRKIPPWNQSTNYAGWQTLTAAACLMQKMDPEEVARIVDKYLGTRASNLAVDDSVPYLLFRVAFAVPTNSTETPRYFKIWRGIESATNQDGTFNPSWPIVWKGDSPILTQGNFGALDNAHYIPSQEYRFFLGKYSLRNLSCTNN